jgi:hypothetical protein
MREDDIRRAIQDLPGERFERFAAELLRRELYPGLNPTSSSHDLGEDARTELSTVFMHNGLRISVSASKTSTWTKIEDDCKRCQDTGRQIDVMVFATAGNPRTDTQEEWRGKVEEQFGWTLECRTMSWFAPAASAPEHESFVDDYLHMPPPGGDFVQTIDREFACHTDQALAQIHLLIPGIAESLPRKEIAWIEDQLHQAKAVLLTGDAGTGKSGIGAKLANSARAEGKTVLYLDARHVGYVQSESQLRQHFALSGPVRDAIQRIGRFKGCRLIIDQLDNTAGQASAGLLVKLALDCSELANVAVVVISRKSEGYEEELLQGLVNAGFVELTSHPLSEGVVADVLDQLDIPDAFPDIVAVGRNLLNLELIGLIKHTQPDFDFSTLIDEVDLWEQYLQVLIQREQVGSTYHDAEQIIAQAVILARTGLNNADRTFLLDYPGDHAHERLISWGIIVRDNGRVYRFRHEKLQDFLYAWDATQRTAMPGMVIEEIGKHRTRNVLPWMDRLYERQQPELQQQFLRETLHV